MLAQRPARQAFYLRSYFLPGVCVAIVVAAVVVYYLVGVVGRIRNENELEQLWRSADYHFRSASFAKAADGYEAVQAKLTEFEWQQRKQEDFELAGQMQKLCEACKAVADELNGAGESLPEQLGNLQEEGSRLLALAVAEADGESPEAKPADNGAKQPVGMAFTPAARWDEVLDWLRQQADARGAKLVQDVVPDDYLPPPHEPRTLDELLTFLEDQSQDTTEARKQYGEFQSKIEFNVLKKNFDEASGKAVQQLDEISISLARSRWQELVARFPGKADVSWWKEHTERLSEALIERLNEIDQTQLRQPAGQVGAEAPPVLPPNEIGQTQVPQPAGRLGAEAPPVLPSREYCSLVRIAAAANDDETEGELRFARIADRCYAVHSSTGLVRWICRVGFDARWLPLWIRSERGERVVVVWASNGQEIVSAATADELKPIWSWRLAAEDSLASPPVVLRGRLYVLLQRGQLWQLDLATGKPVSCFTFPEPIGSPMVIREDDAGILLVGAHLAVYMLEFGPRRLVRNGRQVIIPDCPIIAGIVFPDKSPHALVSRGMWIPPFALVFENELTDKCQIIVFHQQGGDFREVQRHTIAGRLWQAPEVDGPMFLTVTDQNVEAIFGLKLSEPQNPLYKVFSHEGQTFPALQRPYCLTHPEAPFISMSGQSVVRFSVDPLKPVSKWEREVAWEHAMPDTQHVPTQPLQACENGILVAARRPDRSGVRLELLDLGTGHIQWATNLASPAREFYVGPAAAAGYSRVLVRNDCHDFFALTAFANGRWSVQPFPALRANETLAWAPTRDLVAWVSASPPTLYATTIAAASKAKGQRLDSPAATPLSVHEGPLTGIDGDGQPVTTEVGAWTVFLDEDRHLQLIRLDDRATTTQFAELPVNVPPDGWQRPLWLDGASVLLVHEAGFLVWFDVRIEAGVIYLAPREQFWQSPHRIVGTPLYRESQLYVCDADASCHVFGKGATRPDRSVRLPAAATTGPVFFRRLYLGLQNGSLAVLTDSAESGFGLQSELALADRPVRYLTAGHGGRRLLATDLQGRLFEIDDRGRVVGAKKLSAPASAPPLAINGQRFVATADGALWSFSETDLAPPADGTAAEGRGPGSAPDRRGSTLEAKK